MNQLTGLGDRAQAAARVLAQSDARTRGRALYSIARALRGRRGELLEANARDLRSAEENGYKRAFLDRLSLRGDRIEEIAVAVEDIARLPDPVGVAEEGRTLPNGIRMQRIRAPFGVVGMIYEARPNVTVDAAALCLKSGNACMLRGSKEALCSNRALTALMREALPPCGLPEDCITFVDDVTREGARAMMTLNGGLDLLIPRGGAGLIRTVMENATVPVIETGVGNCHTYIDASADVEMAVRILDNAKTSRPSVCNACETVLIHRDIAQAFLPRAKRALDKSGVEWRGCGRVRKILGESVLPATEEDYATEYGDYILAARVVDSLEEAMEHIGRYSSGHSECIVTQDYSAAMRFTSFVDAAAVYVNASTRFTDGGVFGLGAEIGISTQKLHVRGPMGLRDLTTDKYLLFGEGQIRLSQEKQEDE